jgi:hypothetical protein
MDSNALSRFDLQLTEARGPTQAYEAQLAVMPYIQGYNELPSFPKTARSTKVQLSWSCKIS